MKIQKFTDIIEEMKAVTRGEKTAPKDANVPTIESAEAFVRILTPENRSLMRTIRDEKPQSIAELAKLTHRAESNLLRTLSKFMALGLIELKTIQRRKVPVPIIGKLHLEIDPYAMTDRIEIY